MKNDSKDKQRKVGIEIEFADIPLNVVAKIIQSLYQGEIKRLNHIRYEVNNTCLGGFTIELDAKPVQKLVDYSNELHEESLIRDIASDVTEVVAEYSAKIVPIEIIAPPILEKDLPNLERLITSLRVHQGSDTKSKVFNAFGLHINPEVTSFETDNILHHIQSFLLLEPWLYKKHDVDITRRLSSFINPFPGAYSALVLDVNYKPTMAQLITDYHQHNPSRNRPLDCLPLFSYIDQTLITSLYPADEKINPRPTFHYRLPNCELTDPTWSIADEWDNWLNVERLANHKKQLTMLINRWQAWQKDLLSFKSDWINETEVIMREINES